MMKTQKRFFPRIWDGEKYWYPCFSELGITYETDDLPFTEENIKTLDWALGWHFPQNGEDLEFDHEVEGCTGLNDKNSKLVYEGDILKSGIHHYQVAWHDGKFVLNKGCKNYPISGCDLMEIIGNIHKNSELPQCEKNL